MSQFTAQSLQQLAIPDHSEQDLQSALTSETISQPYIDCVVWLCGQLTTFLNLEEAVHTINLQSADAAGDAQQSRTIHSFLLDLSGMLRALECPYPALMDVPLEQKLATPANRLLVVDFLATELQAARMRVAREPQRKENAQRSKPTTAAGEMLHAIGEATGMPASATNSPEQFFQNVHQAIEQQMNTKHGKQVFGQPFLLPNQQFTQNDWQIIEKLNDTLNVEYRARRQMLLKRIDVTLSSFSWAGKAQGKAEELKQKVMPIRSRMSADSYVPIYALIAARDDLLLHEKTTSAKVRATTKSVVNKVLMGAVPDRGGRCDGTRPGDNHMPAFQARREGPGNFGRGRGGGGGFNRAPRGGGRVQGGWARGGRGGRSLLANDRAQHAGNLQQPGYGDDGGDENSRKVYRRSRHQDVPAGGGGEYDNSHDNQQDFYGDDGGDGYDYNVVSGNAGQAGDYPQMMDVGGGAGDAYHVDNQQHGDAHAGGGGDQHHSRGGRGRAHRGGGGGNWRGGGERGHRRGGRHN